MNAVAGRRPECVTLEPTRFEDMRRGCWDIDARIADMDINGVWASLNFPSMITGFCGRVFSGASDPELGLAVTRAWNDWLYEEWWQPYPDRIIPCGITFLADPELGAAEIRRNAERGFRSVTLPERPHRIGLPVIFSGYWDPIMAACEETDTVHLPARRLLGDARPAGGQPLVALGATLFGQMSLTACAEWLWSGLPVRYPDLKIAMSEGGIGWVAMLLDRLDNIVDRSGYGRDYDASGLRPADVLQRNFWFCTIDDPSTIDTRHRIGIDHVMLEVDYPHGDSTWPDTQDVIERLLGPPARRRPPQADPRERRRPLPLAPARHGPPVTCRPVTDFRSADASDPEALLPELTPSEELVLLARTLWREGYDDHLAGHITYRQPDGTLLCNPWLLLWEELRPEDVLVIDLEGSLLEGDWPVPPGIPLHLELHRRRHRRRGGRAQPSPVRHRVGRPRAASPAATTRARPWGAASWSWSTSTTGRSTARTARPGRSRRWAPPTWRCWPTTECCVTGGQHPGRPPAGGGPRVPLPARLAGRGGRARAASSPSRPGPSSGLGRRGVRRVLRGHGPPGAAARPHPARVRWGRLSPPELRLRPRPPAPARSPCPYPIEGRSPGPPR